MALHGGGHLELKKMHKGDFWGLFGIRLGRCPCIIPEKISFLQFYSRFNPNALALQAKCHQSLNRLANQQTRYPSSIHVVQFMMYLSNTVEWMSLLVLADSQDVIAKLNLGQKLMNVVIYLLKFINSNSLSTQ